MRDGHDRSRQPALFFLWAMVALYAVARVLQLSTSTVPMLVVLGLHIWPALAFALVHGAVRYRLRTSVLFIALFLVIGNLIENIGVATAFPFGHYYFTDGMGPKLFHVPVFLGLAYVGMGYVSWVMAEVILTSSRAKPRAHLLGVPMLAALIMTSWDLSQDPVWSTVLHLWTWTKGGAYFGVPWSNFFGWLLTTYLIYACFAALAGAALLRKRSPDDRQFEHRDDVTVMWPAIVFYALSAAGNVLLLIAHPPVSLVTDPTGTQWRVRDITLAGALVSIFVMGAFVVWTSLKLRGRSRKAATLDTTLSEA
jgi:uncharacterized membrane protein